MKSLAMWLVIGVLGLLAVGGVVKASGGEFSWDAVEDKVAQMLVDKMPGLEGFLGASGTRFPHGISADSTSPSSGEVRGTTLTATGAATIGSTLGVSGESQLSTVVAGGSVYTTSTANSTTLTAAQVCDYSVILMSPGLTALNVTLPATSTLYADCLDTDGDYKDVTIRNTTSTASSVMTLVAGTGIVSMGTPTSTASIGDTISTGQNARLRFTRLGDTAGQISVETILFGDAD